MSLVLHPATATSLDGVRSAPAGSVIFHGQRGLGKSAAARLIAAELNCLDGVPGVCAHCHQISAGNYPDLLWIARGDKPSLGIERVRGLTAELALRPYRAGGTRVAVIDEAHLLTAEAQNALLKLLEEPPPATLIILVSEHLESLLLTVRSRCRAVHFVRPGEAAVARLLVDQAGLTGPAAAALATASSGAPGTALALVANPVEASALTELASGVASTERQSLFQRLLLATSLVSSGADLDRFSQIMHRRVIDGLTAGDLAPERAAARLAALEQFRRYLAAKVSPRVALERLMLELG